MNHERAWYKKRIEQGVLSWEALPNGLKTDFRFARSIDRFTYSVASSIFRQFPEFETHGDFWLRIIDRGNSPWIDLHRLIAVHGSAITSVQGVMQAACKKSLNCAALLVDTPLFANHEFWEQLLQTNPAILEHVPTSTLELFPDLVLKTLESIGADPSVSWDTARGIADQLPREWWESRANVLLWFQSGLPYISSSRSFPNEWKKDKAIFLLIARHGKDVFRRHSFKEAAPSLRDDKLFMLQILQDDPTLLSFASQRLKDDFDVSLLPAASSTRSLEIYFRRTGQQGIISARGLARQIDALLEQHRVFYALFLFGISAGSGPLTKLDQGSETTTGFKKLISDYADVPTGKRLRLLRQARSNITQVLKMFVHDDPSNEEVADQAS